MEAPLSLTITIGIAARQAQPAHEGLGLAPGRAVADGDGLDLEARAPGRERVAAASSAAARDWCGIDASRVQQLALRVEADAPCSRCGSRGRSPARLSAPSGGGQQQFAQVAGEDADGLLVGALA